MTKIKWLSYDLFAEIPELTHGTFSRHGGVSSGHFSSLNVGNAVGDHPDYVRENRNKICKQLNLDHLLFPQQEHGSKILRVTRKNISQTFTADGLISNERGIGLGISHADCQAALFYDPVHRAIGAAHAGWRGSVQNIYRAIVEALHQEMKSEPKDLFVAISPSLGPDHAEFKNYKNEFPSDFWGDQVSPNHFDFWEISKRQLLQCGIKESNMECARLCTYCEADDYYSYRREKQTGRNASVIGISK